MDLRESFIEALKGNRELIINLNSAGVLTSDDIDLFNEFQQKLVAYTKFLEMAHDPEVKLPFESEKFSSAWADWKRYKQQQFRFSFKRNAERSALQALFDESRGSDTEAIKMIAYAKKMGYRGIFPIPSVPQAQITKRLNELDEISYGPDITA